MSETVLNKSFHDAPWKAYETQFNDAPWKRYTQQVEEQKRGRMETWRRIRDSFAGDEPLSFVPDEKRQELEEVVSIMENPELEKKKLALAAYYSGLNNQDFPFVYSNIEQACEIANGEKTTVDRAYASIQEYLRGGNGLPGNLDAYKLALEQYEKNHQGFWKGIAGATKNIYWGNIAYLSKLSSWLAWDILGDQGRVYDEAAVKNAQDGFERIYSKRSADINAVRRKAFGIEKQPFRLTPDSDLKTSFAKQNQLGIYELPFKPAYKKGIFGDKTLDEENRKIDENYLTLLRKYPDRYGYVPPEAKTYFDAEKAFWLEVERKYKEKYGETAFANAISAFRLDENNIHRKADFSSKHLRSSMQDSRYVKERIKILQNHFEEKLQENRALYHPGNVETDDLGTLVKNGEYSSALGKGLAIVYDQFTESVFPMAAMAFITGGSSAVPEVAGMKSLGSAALQVGGKAASLGSFAGAMKAEGEKNIFDLNENATAEEIDAYATRHMLYEVLPEYLFGWFPIFKKLAVGGSRKLYKSFWSGVADYGKEFVKGGAKDSFGEFLTFTAEKFDDAMQGFGTPGNKKLSEMSKEEFAAYYMNGFPEMLLGAFFSAAPVSALSHVPQRKAALEMQKATERAAGIIESRIAELSGKETMSEGEKAEFEGLSVALDSGDMRGVFNAAQKLAVEEAIHTEEKYTEEGNRSNDFPDADEEAVANAQLVAPVEQLREKLQHDPADSEAAVNRLRGMFHANIRTTEKWTKSQLAPLLERTMQKYHLTEDEAFEYCSARVPALWVHGEVILNTRNIRPFEVPFKLAHEVALHEGIRKAFGDDAANSLFDMVWKECQNTELMQKILKDYQILKPKYSPDGKPVTDEDGNPIYLDLSQNEQREAAEEFLAHLQETNGVPLSEIYQDHRAEIDAWGRENGYDTKDLLKKEDMVKNWMASTGFRPERPGWLKQIIAQVRIWLHKHGWFVQHLSDDDIQTILAKSAEAVSNSKFKAGNIRYSVENAMPSKAGFRVERINENAGQEFNEAKGVIVKPEQVYKVGEVPKEQPRTWIRKRCVEYVRTHYILGEHETPALGDGVKVSVGSVKAVLNHPGSDIKNNLIAAIPDMLKNAVLIQVENNGRNKTYLLAAKVRYGEDERFIIGMIIHESQGKFYYDHELVEIENADIQNGLPLSSQGTSFESAPVLTVIQNVLFASGFDKKSEKNSRFSVLPKDENLVVVHNLSASKLRNAAKLGGLPVPSLAIIDAEKSDFTNYGEISLIADKDLIDPKYRSNRVYNTDIYSARAPRKPQRAVWLDEFKAAVIPDDAPADVRKLLEDAGLQIYTYGKIPRKAALQMATMDKKVRFAIDGAEMDSRTKNLITMMRPIVGEYPKQDGDYYAKQMRDKFGVHVDSVEAWVIAIEAVRENQLEARRRGIRLRNKWLYENFPLYREVVDFCGENFIIKPAYRFTGEKFSGSWISPEFVKYSEKRPQGKSESDSSYRRYLARREIALRNATGHDSDEIAEAIARKWGRDALDVEQELIEFFRDLSKKEFYHNYTEWKQENIFADKQAKERAKDEWMKQEQAKIEDEVVSLLEHGKPISEEWVRNNRKIYQELYRQLFPGKDIPYSPGKADLEAINAALIQEGENASTYAQAYKAAREKAFEEFMNRLSAFRDKVMKNKSSAVKLQRDALDFAEKNLQPENRGEFARNIVSLLEYSTAPSGKYPEGRRMHEFRNLFDRIVHRASEVRKTKGATAIKEMLDAARIKRNYKGIPTSILPSEQAKIDRIRQVVNMNLPTLLNAIEYNNQKIMELEGSEENDNLLQNFLEDNRILETFGNLENKTADETEAAARMLESIIRGGKAKFKDALTERKAKIDKMRTRAVNDATFGKNEFSDRGDAKKHRGYWLKNESLGTLMRIASGKSIQDFENSVGGELYKKVEDSTQEEQTRLRHLQEDFDSALRNIVGISGNKIQSMREKGKFFRMLSEVVEHTGVFKMEYSRTIKTGPVDFVFEHGRRGLMKKLIPVEDYEWNGKMRPGARSLLKRIDNGEKVLVWQDMVLDDVSIAFLRQQLADYDAGLKQAYEIFNDESDDANFNRMIEDERKSGKLILFSHIPDEVSKIVEIPLSQGAALQILLTWEQEHYQPNMKWNGWSEESIEQLKKFLKPEVLKMGYWMRDQIAKNKADLDKKVFERYGAHLPLTENYFPAAFRGGKTKSVQVESELGRGAGSMSINPNFLIARKFHLNPVDTDADAFSSFLSNQVEQAHFISWGDTVRDLKAVYGGTMVQKAIADKFGKEVVNNLVDRVATIARGGGQFSGDYAARLMTKLYRYWIPAKIALNPSSFIKQIFGTVAYMNHVPVKEFVTYFAKANFSNPDYRAFVAWAKKTDYMKNRLAGGLDKDLSYLMNYTRDSKAYSPWSDALMNIGTWGTRWSDAWSTLHGGYAAYMYALDQARAAGYSESDAREAARRAWMRATDETQQSGYLKDQNYFQSNQGAFRYLTAFMTNPIQIMNLQLQTINEIRYGSDKKSAWKKLGRQILVNHLIVPTLMQFTTDMLRNGFNLADWWDELQFEDYLLAWMMGSFESMFLFGKLISNLGGYTLDRIFGRKAFFMDSISAMPLADDLQRDIGLFFKLAEGEKPLTEKELMDAIKAFGDIGMVGGIWDGRLGTTGAILHAIGAQGKRIFRWIDDDK